MSTPQPTSTSCQNDDSSPRDDVAKSDAATPTSRFRHELCQPMFHLREPDGKAIDIKRRFAPAPAAPMLVAKAAFFSWTLATIVVDDVVYFERAWFSLAYLTHWALILTLLYQAFSILVAARLSRSDSGLVKTLARDDKLVHRPALIAWCLFSAAATLEVVVALSYWPLLLWGVVAEPVTYNNAMTHGGVAVLVLVDGLVLNRTPLRVKQVAFPMLVGAIYALWTVVHWRLGIGNPEEDYDTIYPTLDWERHKLFSLVQCGCLTAVLIPSVFLCLRWISLRLGGRTEKASDIIDLDASNKTFPVEDEELDIEGDSSLECV